ncbi:hypothetical protein M5689_014313 [Euphorbia peplus]|nr:hypothetical protein M5689_014313 [Euphorbia peplus]
MGNCLHHDASVQWGSDDCRSSSPESMNTSSHHDYYGEKEDKKGLLLHQECLKSSSNTNKEVKIKISKKQLVELLGKVDMNELSIEQVLTHLMNITDSVVSYHNRPWKSNLQTIPE